MNKKIIVIFAYNRANMIKRMLQSLGNCDGIEKYDIWIFFDASKDNLDDEKKVYDARHVAEKILDNGYFKNIKTFYREKHLGLAESVISGITKAFSEYDSVICLEDDLVFSQDYLMYMSSMLDKYREDKKIWSISGYSPFLNRLEVLDSELYLGYRASSWGWGMWKDRWESIDWNMTDYATFRFSLSKRKSFSRGGVDMPLLLDMQMNGIVDSWAIRWCYEQWKQDKITVFPKETRVEHIGYDSTSTHNKKKKRKEQVLKDNHKEIIGEAIFDNELLEEFREYNKCSRIKIIIKIIIFGKCVKVVKDGWKKWKASNNK
jgi:hypothetical protein